MPGNRIIRAFDNAATTYDKAAFVQKQSAQILKEMFVTHHPEVSPSSILDLGCGTGYMTEALLSSFPKASYCLNDISHNMLTSSQKKYQHLRNITFQEGDMQSIELVQQDLIASNLAIQWTSNLSECIKKCYSYSKYFIFSLILDGTFQEWQQLLKNYDIILHHNFPTKDDIRILVEDLGANTWHYEEKTFDIEFATPYDFASYLKAIGANAHEGFSCYNKLLPVLRKEKRAFKTQYKILYGVLKK